MLAFGGTRTWHRLAVAIEDAGFEIRDSIAWLYGNGFPKNKAALKPAFEPVVMARKPFKGSLSCNEATYETGVLNIDASRIGEQGRWPANVVLDQTQAAELDEQSGPLRARGNISMEKRGESSGITGWGHGRPDANPNAGDRGGASRFFYCGKAPKSERPVVDSVTHPTVKPLNLMRYLVKLVTPSSGTVLDPFAGSGSTVEACLLEGLNVIAIEREVEYLPLIKARIERNEAA